MSYLGYHPQTPVNGWLDAVARSQPKVIKVFQIEMGAAVKAVSPGTIVVFRHHVSHQQPFLDLAVQGHEQALEAAANFINQFEDSLNRQGGIDYVESLNETVPTANVFELQKAVAFDIGFCEALAQICPNVKPVVFTAAIGNPDFYEFPHLLPLAESCAAFGGAMGYHAYHPVVDGESFVHSIKHQRDLHLRWTHIDDFLINHGHTVDWFLGEIGPIGANGAGYNLRANDGWKHPGVWADNRFACLEDLAAFDRLLAGTRAAQENRLIGAALFTSGQWDWEHFQYQQPILDDVADYVAANPSPEPEPPAPPEPEPVPERAFGVDVSKWQGDQIDWAQVAADGAEFAIIRASVGQVKDHVYDRNYAGAKAAGLFVGSYHYLHANGPVEQARHFVASRKPGDLPDVLDVEGDGKTAVIVGAFLDEYWRLTGRGCMIYTAAYVWNAMPGDKSWASNYPLWVANYTDAAEPLLPRDWDTWDFWQFTSSGAIDGIAGRVDLNIFKGTSAELREYVGKPEPPPQPPPEPVRLRVVCDFLNMRTGPGTAHHKTGQLWRGTEVEIGGQYLDPDGNTWAWFAGLWAAVRYNGVTLMEVVE